MLKFFDLMSLMPQWDLNVAGRLRPADVGITIEEIDGWAWFEGGFWYYWVSRPDSP